MIFISPKFDKKLKGFHLQAMNLCAYQTGMRLGEVLGLPWNRVDFQQGLIQLRAEDTKTREARIVPMTAELTALLKNLYKVRYLGEEHVFLVKGKSVGAKKPPIMRPVGERKFMDSVFMNFAIRR